MFPPGRRDRRDSSETGGGGAGRSVSGSSIRSWRSSPYVPSKPAVSLGGCRSGSPRPPISPTSNRSVRVMIRLPRRVPAEGTPASSRGAGRRSDGSTPGRGALPLTRTVCAVQACPYGAGPPPGGDASVGRAEVRAVGSRRWRRRPPGGVMGGNATIPICPLGRNPPRRGRDYKGAASGSEVSSAGRPHLVRLSPARSLCTTIRPRRFTASKALSWRRLTGFHGVRTEHGPRGGRAG